MTKQVESIFVYYNLLFQIFILASLFSSSKSPYAAQRSSFSTPTLLETSKFFSNLQNVPWAHITNLSPPSSHQNSHFLSAADQQEGNLTKSIHIKIKELTVLAFKPS